MLSKAFGSQKPLNQEGKVDAVEKYSRVLTSENWQGYLDASTETARAADEDGEEWLFYFTSSNLNGTRNSTLWDSVYDETVYSLSTTTPASKINFAKADCASPEATTLCHSFYLTQNWKLPLFYHLVSYPNNTIEARRVPLNRTLPREEQPRYFARYLTEKEWKNSEPWTNLFNPVSGLLKDVSPYLALALKGYEMMPQWLFMILVTVFGRYMSARVADRTGLNRPPRSEAAPAAGS
jgi:hypothetical protein